MTMTMVDPYELLGVPRCATTADVATAHERLAAVFDPQRWEAAPGLWREAMAWTQAIDEARQAVLSNS